jgi:O-antigen/teichoic acid export membrane protein
MSVRRHTAYNVVGAVVPLIAVLLTLPRFIAVVGEARYGVLAILWTLLGYLGLFDLGLGRAVTNRIAALGGATSGEREEVLWTALLINVGLGIGGALVLWGVGAVLFGYIVDVPGPLEVELSRALPWIAAAFPLLLTTSVLSGALMGREEFLSTSAVQVGEGVLVQVVPLAVAIWLSPTLPALVVAVLVVRTLSGLVLFALCLWRLPVGLVPRPKWTLARPLFAYGGWVTVTGIVGPLLSTLDRVIIGAVSGVRAVTYYVVPFSLASRFTILSGSFASALFPRFSALTDDRERGLLLLRSVRTLSVVLTVPVLIALIGAAPFFAWWMGDAFARRAAGVAEVLLVGVWLNGLAALPYAYLQGIGRPDIVARYHVLETPPYLLGLWLCLGRFGVAGAATVWTLRVVLDTALLFRASGQGGRVLRHAAVPLGVLLAALALSRVGPELLLVRLGAGLVLVAVAALWSWRAAPDDFRNAVRVRLARRSAPMY